MRSATAARPSGTVTGSVSLATGIADAPRLPTGLEVIVTATCEERGGNAVSSLRCGNSFDAPVAANGSSMPFTIGTLPFGIPLTFACAFVAPGAVPGRWHDERFAHLQNGGTLTAARPHGIVAFSAGGVRVPPDVPGETNVTGDVAGAIVFPQDVTRPGPLPPGTHVTAYAASDPEHTPLGTATLSNPTALHDGRDVEAFYRITGLQLDRPLAVAVAGLGDIPSCSLTVTFARRRNSTCYFTGPSIRAAASRPPAVEPRASAGNGTISGTIELATDRTDGATRLPSGTSITLRLFTLSGNPVARHPTFADTQDLLVSPPGVTSLHYAFKNVIPNDGYFIDASVASLSDGPHAWSSALVPPDRKVGVMAGRRHVSGEYFSARGIFVPDDATADGVIPLGRLSGTVEDARPAPHSPVAGGLHLRAYAASDPARVPLGIASASDSMSLDDLPLNLPLEAVVVDPDGLPVSEIEARPSGTAVCAVLLTFERRASQHCTFRATLATPSTPRPSPTQAGHE